MKKWIIGITSLVVVGLLGMVAGGLITHSLSSPVHVKTTEKDTRVVQAIERQEKIILLKAGVTGVTTKKQSSEVFGLNLPGSSRAMYLQYRYSALLGIDGADVSVTQTADHEFTLHIPAFQQLGQSDIEFSTVVEQNGLISFVTPKIDVSQMTNDVLNSESTEKILSSNRAELQDQCRKFYTGIIQGIDPEAKVTLEFPTT